MAEHSFRISDADFVRRVLIVGAIGTLGWIIWLLSDVILLIFGAVLWAVALGLMAKPFSRAGLTRPWALACAGLAALLILVSAAFYAGAEVTSQFGGLSGQLNRALQRLNEQFGMSSLGELAKGLPTSGLADLLPRFVSWGQSLGGVLIGMALIIVGGIYIAADPATYREGFLKLVPASYQARIRTTFDEIERSLELWLGGQFTAMTIVGFLTGAGLWLTGTPSALALGLLAGLLNFVPYIGSIVSAAVTLTIAASVNFEQVLWAAGVMLIVQQIESNVITPLVVGRAVSIQPAVGLFAIVIMGVVFGPLGVLFGFPLAIVADIAIRRLYVRETLDEPVEILGKPAEKSATGG